MQASFAVLLSLVLTMAIYAKGDELTTDSLSHYRAVLANPGLPLHIVALGDSNTEINWTSRGHLNWVGLMAAGLFEGGGGLRHRIHNAGVSGNTALDGLARLEEDVLRHNPDLVIISFGLNDFSRYAPEETAGALRSIIRRIREAGNSSILLRTPQPLFDAENNQWLVPPELAATVNAIRRVADEENISILDHLALWTLSPQPHTPAHYSYNRLHPNEFGHRLFYDELASTLSLPTRLLWEKAADAKEEEAP